MRKTLSAAFAAVVLGAMSAMPAMPASATTAAAPTLHYQVSNRVAVLASGAALAVPVSYVCPSKYASPQGSAIWIGEVHQQLADGSVVDGFDPGGTADDLVCDGALRQHEIIILPFEQRAFEAPGTASVTVSILACNAAETNCKQPSKTLAAELRNAAPGDPANQPAPAVATLLNNGDVRVVLQRGCPAGSSADAGGTIAQRVRGDRVTQGFDEPVPTTCTATTTTMTIRLSPFNARRGPAYVIGDARTCNGLQCTEFRAFHGTLQIT
jgi:hypothetical protein